MTVSLEFDPWPESAGDNGIRLQWSGSMQVEHAQTGKSWRARLAWFLRRLADRIDGRRSLTVFHISRPAIAEAQLLRGLRFGMLHAAEIINSELRSNAVEHGMVEAGGWYEEEKSQ